MKGIENTVIKGEIYTKEKYISAQVDFFKAHSTEQPKLLGMEFEHFLLDRETLRSYDYFEENGQRQMMKDLTEKDWKIIIQEDDYILGLEKNGDTITLEPGGQVEISLRPLTSVIEIEKYYLEVIEEINNVLMPNQMLAGIGYHPVTRIEELSLLPKKRYAMMYDYFQDNGIFCHNMMKGTAATQVSIDYKDEEDFIKKFRVANYISPAMASLFDATPFFEGVPTIGKNMRARIWAETDVKRSKLIPGSLTTHFDFKSYAEYLLKLPPILLYTEGKLIYSKDEPLLSSLSKYPFYESELEHHQSMVFPDVRLKRFIEIRMPDSLPFPYSLAVGALVKAVFYTPSLLEKYYQESLAYDDAWVESQNTNLQAFTNLSLMDTLDSLKLNLLNDAQLVLSEGERVYIKQLQEVLGKYGSITDYLLHQYDQSVDLFAESIEIRRK